MTELKRRVADAAFLWFWLMVFAWGMLMVLPGIPFLVKVSIRSFKYMFLDAVKVLTGW